MKSINNNINISMRIMYSNRLQTRRVHVGGEVSFGVRTTDYI